MSMLNNSPYFSGKVKDLQENLFTGKTVNGQRVPGLLESIGFIPATAKIAWLPCDYVTYHRFNLANQPDCVDINNTEPLYGQARSYRDCNEQSHMLTAKVVGMFDETCAGAVLLGLETRILISIVTRSGEPPVVTNRRWIEISPRDPALANMIDKLFTVAYKKVTIDERVSCIPTENVWLYKNVWEQLQEPIPIFAAPVTHDDEGNKILNTSLFDKLMTALGIPVTCCNPDLTSGDKKYISYPQMYQDFVFNPEPFYLPTDELEEGEYWENLIVKKWFYLKIAYFLNTFRPSCYLTPGEGPLPPSEFEQEPYAYEPYEVGGGPE